MEPNLPGKIQQGLGEHLRHELAEVKLPEVSNNLPFFSFDLDGVIGTPLFNYNIAVRRSLHEDELPEKIGRLDGPVEGFRKRTSRKFYDFSQNFRYFGRRPMPNVQEGLEAITQVRNLVIITGRSFLAKRIVEAWLKRYGLDGYFAGIYPNFTDQSTRKYKLYLLRQFGIQEHADDDGSITYYLAKRGIPRLYLRDWPQNAGLPYPDTVVHFRDVIEIARHLQEYDRRKNG